jgi:hypothetical protein
MMNNLVTYEIDDNMGASLLISAVEIEWPQRGMPRIIPTNWNLRVMVHGNAPCIK